MLAAPGKTIEYTWKNGIKSTINTSFIESYLDKNERFLQIGQDGYLVCCPKCVLHITEAGELKDGLSLIYSDYKAHKKEIDEVLAMLKLFVGNHEVYQKLNRGPNQFFKIISGKNTELLKYNDHGGNFEVFRLSLRLVKRH